MEIVSGQRIQGESILIDDKTFIACQIVDCILVYNGGPIAFQRTTLSRCRYVFTGPARQTLHFLQNTGLMPHDPAEWGEFYDTVN